MPLLHAARFDCAAHDRERTTESITRSVWAVATPALHLGGIFAQNRGSLPPKPGFSFAVFFQRRVPQLVP